MGMSPYFSLIGQTALVTGAAKGLGRECALALAQAGADVAIGVRDVNAAADLVTEIEATGRRAITIEMDVHNLARVREGVAEAAAALGRLDILVNNVGGAWGSDLLDVTEDQFDYVMSQNVKGSFFASQVAAKIMREQAYGRIINMSSQAGTIVLPGDGTYCMAKAALNHLTRCMAIEWGGFGITVNAVSPTFVWTPGTTPYLSDPARRADVEERIAALHRIGEPREVAAAVLFLASRESSLVTGTTMLVDGGWTIR
jgi:NAD(P)-dependent dehydrogenase (short-subunit alcohol dehydrogenase family)